MKTTSAPTVTALPAAVARYVEAANRLDAAAAADCFTADASVHDENRDFVGRGAVRAWVAETGRKYRPALTVMRASVCGDEVGLSVAVSGQFPGSPVTLDYLLCLRDGRISALTIE